MTYSIRIEKPAEKFIRKLPAPDRVRVLRAIAKLPNDGDIKQLKGQKSGDYFRLRVGTYRIIYTVDHGNLIVCVIDAGNRGQIYNSY